MASWIVGLGDGTKAKLTTDDGWTHKDSKLQKRLNDEFPPGIRAFRENEYTPDPYGDSAEDVAKQFHGTILGQPPPRGDEPSNIPGFGGTIY